MCHVELSTLRLHYKPIQDGQTNGQNALHNGAPSGRTQ